MFDKLKKLLEGGVAQVNPWDNGKTFQSVVNNRTPQQQNAVQQQQQQARVFNPARPQQAPQQNFTDKLRDILDANSQADKFRRAQEGQALDYRRQQQDEYGVKRPAMNVGSQVLGNAARFVNTAKAGVDEASDTSMLLLANQVYGDRGRDEMLKRIRERQEKQYAPNSGLFGAGTWFDSKADFEKSTANPVDLVVNKAAPGVVGTAFEAGSLGAGQVAPKLAVVGAKQFITQGAKAAGARAVEGVIADAASQKFERDRYSPEQSAVAAVTAAGLPIVARGAGKVVSRAIDAAGNAVGRKVLPRSVAEITQEVATARQPVIANNAPRVTPDGTILPPRPASEIAAELAASKARAADPNVQAKMASIKAAGQPSTPVKKINMTPDDQRILADFNDIANGVYKPDAKLQRKIELDATYIAEKYNIPLRSTPQEMAEEFDNVLQRGVTKPEFAPKPQQYNQLAPKPSKQDPLEALKAEARQATGARSDYSPENLQANRQIRAKNASSITYADKKAIKPDELVTVYRAVPGKAKGGLTEGDWVTPNKEQARLFMKQSWAQDDTGAKIVTKKVKASELRYHADDAKGYVDDELLYVPKSDPLEALKQEARKYKSADTFAMNIKDKEIGDNLVVYKGTGGDLDMGGATGFDYLKKVGDSQKDMPKNTSSFSQDKFLARQYGDVTPYTVPKKDVMPKEEYSKLIGGITGVGDNSGSALRGMWRRSDKYPSVISDVKKAGYKGFTDVNGEIVMFDKSSLTDLYNQAHAKPTKPKAYYQNVPKSYTESSKGAGDHWTTPLRDNGPTPIPTKLDSNGVQIKPGDKIEFYGASPDGKKGTSTIHWTGPYKANASGKEFPGQWIGNGTLDNNIPFKIIERDGKPFNPSTPSKSYTEPKKTAFEQNTGVTAPTRKKGTLNTERLDLTDAQKADLASRQDPILETMSHKEIQDIAKSVGIDTRSHTIDQTKEIIAKQLNTRREVVALEKQAADLSSKGGDPVKLGNLYARIDELSRASTEQATDLGRQLSARRILADESKSPVQRVFGLLRKAGVNPEVYTKEAVGVNFNNPNEVIKYYRKLVPPTKGEWLGVVRYNSMLSSPLTQIVNVSSTAGNISIAPIERTIASNLDFIHSLATGKPRKFAGGEGLAYAKGMIQSVPDALRAFRDSIKGIDENMNLDVSMQGGHIPVAAQGQNKLVDVLQFPMKLLGAFDNYHRVIVAGGSDAALSKRIQAGIGVRNREVENAAEGAYRTFNQEIGEKSQGALLGGIDEVTAAVNRLRSSKYAVVRLPAKFTLPFVRIGANLMKQGIEYSPAGFATIPGANDKTTQLAKALMGTAVFGTAAGLLGKDRLTWAEPVDPDQKAAFKQAGKQPYSMKIGDNWIGFSKLPPIISFNMAMVAALDDAVKSAKLNENGVDNVVTAIAKYGNFLADQSYVKSVGDLLAAVKGDPEKLTALVSNYPQQMVPMRAFSGWIAKMTDDTQRKVNTDAGFAAKQVESLMQQIPGLRQQTTARVNEYGEPIASQHPVLNAFSPVPVSTENPDGVLAYDTMVNRLKTKRDDKALLAKQKEDYKSGNASGLTDKQKAAVDRSIREDEVVKGLTPVQRELYKYSKEDLESLLDGPNAKNAKVALDAKNNISSSKEAKTNKEKYEQALEKFNDPDNGYSKVEKVKKTEELKRLTVQKDYDEDTTMLHGMSKEDVWGFLSTYEDGKAMADKLLALDDALTAAGVQDKNKFRDKYGNIAIKPKEKSSGKGGSKAKTVKGQAEAVSSERKLRALLANTNNKTSYRKPATQSAKVGLKKFAVKSAGITSRKGA